MQIAIDFFEMGIAQTRRWIANQHPEFSEDEITLEYVRLEHYLPGHIKEVQWQHFQCHTSAYPPGLGQALSPHDGNKRLDL